MKDSMREEEHTTTSEQKMETQFPGSLRDWLAGMALQGEFASQSELTGVISSEKCMLLTAKRCYQMADAMLAERSKRDDG